MVYFLTIIAEAIKAFCVAVGAVWSVFEFLSYYFPDNQKIQEVTGNIGWILIPALLFGVYKVSRTLKMTFYPTYRIGNKTIKIRVKNILKCKKGTIVAGVNEQLKTSKEEIGETSIHYQLVHMNEERIREIFETHKQSSNVSQRFFQGKVDDLDIIFLKMSDLPHEQKATTSAAKLEESFYELFHHQEKLTVKSKTLYCPLLGKGAASAPVSYNDVVKMMIRNFLAFQKSMNGESTDRIETLVIVVYRKDFKKIDYVSLHRDLKNMIANCYGCTGLIKQHTDRE